MAISATQIINDVVSHALTQGVFDSVQAHEPKRAPGFNLWAAVWVDRITPVSSSGLASTSVRFVLTVRCAAPMLTEPQDVIDPNLVHAVDLLMAAYSGDFTLGDTVRNVDLLGQHGIPLEARAGYLNQDGTLFRVIDIVVPLIVNDAWTQAA